MTLALLYDVHGNLPALEAVLEDADAERWVLGGDHIAFGGWPAECLEALRGLDNAVWIRGNTERWLKDASELPADAPQHPALRAAADAVGPDAVASLTALPERISLAEGHFCHASPLSDMESFAPEHQEDEDRLLDGTQDPRVVFGHTHVQFRRLRDDGRELVNPGSVGMPLDGDPRAAYAVIGEDGQVQLRRVAYDHERAAAQAREVAGELFADRIRTARP